MGSAFGEGSIVAFTGEKDVDRAGEELPDCPSLDSDLDLDFDLFKPGETDLDLDRLPLFFGDLDLLFPGSGECDLDRRLRDSERDLERLDTLGGERLLLAGDRERLLTGDLVLDRRRDGGVLDLERRLRFRTTIERERVRLLLRIDRERERRDLGGGDLLRRDKDRLLDRLPPVRLTGVRDLERRTARLDLEVERRVLVTERDRDRLPTVPRGLGERVLERLAAPRERDFDLRFLLGERDREGDLRPLRLGDRDTILLGDGEPLQRLGETDKELLRRLGDLDFLGDFAFFLGVSEREVDRDWQLPRLGDLDGERNFRLDLGD